MQAEDDSHATKNRK